MRKGKMSDGYLVYVSGAWRVVSGDPVQIREVEDAQWNLTTDPLGDQEYRCSICNTGTYHTSPYCPWCGNPMDVSNIETEARDDIEDRLRSYASFITPTHVGNLLAEAAVMIHGLRWEIRQKQKETTHETN